MPVNGLSTQNYFNLINDAFMLSASSTDFVQAFLMAQSPLGDGPREW